MNAAIWFGAAIFCTFGALPAIFDDELLAAAGNSDNARAWLGNIAQMVLGKFFALSYCCGAIAITHLLAEWLYLGKAIHKVTLWILTVVFSFSLIGGLALQPKLRDLHHIKYMPEGSVPTPNKQAAIRSFTFWHSVSQFMNLAMLVGLGVYVWRVTHAPDAPRFVSATKFRS